MRFEPRKDFQRGAYRALPGRRGYIPKSDGRLRPLAIAALEDKIVQRATVAVLNVIYEEDFLGFSYGFERAAAHMMHWTRSSSESAAQRTGYWMLISAASLRRSVKNGWSAS